jgi:hypothetical protein
MKTKYLTCKICGSIKKIYRISTLYKVCYTCIDSIPDYLKDAQRLKWLKVKIEKVKWQKNINNIKEKMDGT